MRKLFILFTLLIDIFEVRKLISFVFIVTICLSVSCSAVKNLKPDEALLFSQSIEGNKQIGANELTAFFRQKPNRRLLNLPINPYVPIYFWGKQRYDSIKIKADSQKLAALEKLYEEKLENEDLAQEERQKLIAKKDKKTAKIRLRLREGNWLMRSVGEKPVIFDSALMHKTASQLKLFLHQNGFFASNVVATYQIKKQKAKIVYQIIENQPHTIRKIIYSVQDSVVAKLILKDTLLRLFQPKQRYNESLLEGERNRITRRLKDEGYFEFTKQLIFFKIDSINPPKYSLDIKLIVENVAQKAHKRWEIGEVVVISDVNTTSDKVARVTEVYDSVNFKSYIHQYSNKILSRRVKLRPNQYYSQALTEDTQRALSMLEMFKFVNIKYDTVKQKLRANIYASPATKYSFTVEGGGELNLNQTIPGPFGSFSFRNLNTFGGCEVFNFKIQASLEAQGAVTTTSPSYQSQVVNVSNSITFPRIIFPIPKKMRKNIEVYNPTTKLALGLQYVNRPEFNRLTYQTSFGYSWTRKQKHFFTFNLADISITRTPFIATDYIKLLQEEQSKGNNLILSFRSAFISSLSFTYVYNTYTPARKTNARYFRLFLESGGTTLNLLSKDFLKQNKTIFGDLSYYRFLKMQADFRYYVPTNNNGTLAFRCNLGLASPYGTTANAAVNVLPYEKYFTTGGGNSIRGWKPQRLGAGGYLRPDSTRNDGSPGYAYIEYGEMLLELSVEYRKKLFGFVHGAAFVDAGNVWMLSQKSTPNSLFKFDDFYKQIAVGGGLGLRFDFSFLILRLDMGMKLVEPGEYDAETLKGLGLPENYRKKPLFDRSFFGELADWYFGIGYPF